jgi:hypothetical protein
MVTLVTLQKTVVRFVLQTVTHHMGEFGCVSEGVDATEVPIIAYTDNRDKQAQVAKIITDSDRILALEYLNAGREYDTNGGNAVISIVGDGFGLGTVTPVYRTAGVMEVRLLNTNDEFGEKIILQQVTRHRLVMQQVLQFQTQILQHLDSISEWQFGLKQG